MTTKRIIGLSCLGVSILGITGCAKYRAKPLKNIHPEFNCKTHNQSDVTFAYKPFTKDDCMEYLDRDVIKAGFQPIHIHLENNSSEPIIFSTEGISFPCVPMDVVAKKVHTSTSSRVLAWGIPGLFIWPFLIPAVVDGIGSAEANGQLDVDFAGKSVKGQIIQPRTSLDGLIFVRLNEYREPFTVTVIGQKTGDKIIFGE
jgi:hypothetical protein